MVGERGRRAQSAFWEDLLRVMPWKCSTRAASPNWRKPSRRAAVCVSQIMAGSVSQAF